MNFNEYQKHQRRTSATVEGCESDGLINGCLGLAGETGEVCDLIKKHIFQGHPLNLEKLKEELGDVLWYISEVVSGLGLEFDEVASFNVEKLRKRYPDGFDSERSINR